MTRPQLRVVASPGAANATAAFCGYCGTAPDPAAAERICGSCGLGVVLHSEVTLAPAPHSAFLVVDQGLCVGAVSQGAEHLLGTAEPDAVNRHLAELLVPAAAEARGANLLELVVAAAGGSGAARTAVVRPAGEFGVRFLARVGPCGPPTAALVVLDEL